MAHKSELTLDLTGTDAALRATVATCLGRYCRSEARLQSDASDTTLHQARVDLRRLRAALRIFRSLASPPVRLSDQLQALSAALGKVRDLDMLRVRAPPGPLEDRLAAARAVAFSDVLALLQTAAHRRLLVALTLWVVVQPALPDLPAKGYAAALFERWRRQLKRAGEVLEQGDDADRHRLRKRVKRLRHATELLGGLFPRSGRRARFLEALARLSDELGTLNDRVTARALLTQMHVDAVDMGALVGNGRRDVERASAAHEQLMAVKRFWR